MTIKRFNSILQQSTLNKIYYKEVPLRAITKPLAVCPKIKELFVKMTVAILEKS